ncbi:OmpW family outer membrane protein [Acinetobacter sp. CWB-B33]|uniref:OmpW/AlkL family protein n=1 Tax=Acinetobacter sp. CWB-B33 TaxID=2815724 RepID=UPI0031FEB1AC
MLFGVTHTVLANNPDGFKRFSVSAGWLHVMPQGKANPFNINTAVKKGTVATVGSISEGAFVNSIDPNATNIDYGTNTPFNTKDLLKDYAETGVLKAIGISDADGNIIATESGTAVVNGLDSWQSGGTGLEAEDVDTLGLTFNYYLNDNVSLQFIGGLPPKVDIKGKGEITAPLSGHASPTGISGMIFPDGLDLKQDIPITNLSNKSKAATARAWTPALEAQYQFGKSGVNKFRPYIGAGLMYAYFNDIKLNSEIRSDLEAAGHMIQNVLDNKAGAALDGKVSSGIMRVDVDADDAIAPIITAGFTYDLNDHWYGVASVSYAKLNNKTTINVVNESTGQQLIHATTKIDIDPLITYLGVGYRF